MKRVLPMVLIAASLLAGCGVRGELQRPPPMFGEGRDAYIAQQKAEQEAKAAQAAAGQTPAPPPPSQPIQTSPIQAGIAPPVPTTPAR